MLEAAMWGAIAASSLLLGAALALAHDFGVRTVGAIMAFGAGVLISAVSFELAEEAFRLAGAWPLALGLAAGALVYFGANRWVSERGGHHRKDPAPAPGASATATGLVLGAVLDAIPESAVIGLSLLEGEGVSVPVLAAVFISNVPEAMGAAAGTRGRRSPAHVMATWLRVVAISAVAAAVGYGALGGAADSVVAGIQAFAAGAILVMLVDTMVPEASTEGRPIAGLATTLGFAVAYLLSVLG